jgi:hypothetical protein
MKSKFLLVIYLQMYKHMSKCLLLRTIITIDYATYLSTLLPFVTHLISHHPSSQKALACDFIVHHSTISSVISIFMSLIFLYQWLVTILAHSSYLENFNENLVSESLDQIHENLADEIWSCFCFEF